jgi:hypothetical protein
MLSIVHMLEAVLVRLSMIPGLGFLYDYLHELETQQLRRRQMVDTYKGYGRALRDAGQQAKQGGHGHGHGDHGGHEEEGGHGAPGKRGKSARPAARPGRGGQVARSGQGKEDDPDDLEADYYEDDDFESYLQH